MVYKIRNKNFFWTRGGWKNNWFPKHLNMPKPFGPESTFAIRTRYDHHSFLRMHQSYRNLARHAKQYFYGDRETEEGFTETLRQIFNIPRTYETPVHLIKHGGERRMADQLDRDVELFSYNTHPYQLHTYKAQNARLDKEIADAQVRADGGVTGEDQLMTHFQSVVEAEVANLPKGEKMSIERYTELAVAVMRKYQADVNMPVSEEDANGEMKDFQEVRRPFVSSQEGSMHSS